MVVERPRWRKLTDEGRRVTEGDEGGTEREVYAGGGFTAETWQ